MSDPDNPSAPAILGSVAVGARQAGGSERQPAVYAAGAPEAAAVRDSGLNAIGPGALVVPTVAETLRIAGQGAGELPATAAMLSLNADENLIQVATVQTNREEGSTDTVVYAARAAAGGHPLMAGGRAGGGAP